jgi:hypothetical protein
MQEALESPSKWERLFWLKLLNIDSLFIILSHQKLLQESR